MTIQNVQLRVADTYPAVRFTGSNTAEIKKHLKKMNDSSWKLVQRHAGDNVMLWWIECHEEDSYGFYDQPLRIGDWLVKVTVYKPEHFERLFVIAGKG